MKLADQTIIVTGGASGIGRATCFALAAEGVRLVVADFNLAGAESVAAEVAALGGKAHAFEADVSKPQQVEAMVQFAVDQFGGLTGLFNNAGIGATTPFLEMAPAAYLRTIEIDQHSVFYGTYYAAKKMVALGVGGVIVNTASIYGSVAAPGCFDYNAAKAAVLAMTRSGALELAPYGIRVVAVAPGFIETAMMDGLDQAARDYLAAQHVTKRLISPEKVASVVTFLFSDAAAAINGSSVAVDDGFLAFKA